MQTLLIKDHDQKNIQKAADIIKHGGLVVFPTETVYGLGANALDKNAVTNIYKAKGRPMDNPLIVHLAKPEDAEKYAYTNDLFYKLAKIFMPGPLTVILPKKEIIPYEVTCGLDTVALRVPSNDIAHELIEKSGCPIAAPSANLSGKPSPTSFDHVIKDMSGRADAIIDGGKCTIGLESTVIILNGSKTELLRPGKITYEELKQIIPHISINNAVKNKCVDNKPASPGMKYRHYAPQSPVFLIAGTDENVIDFLKNKQQNEKCGILCFEEDLNFLLPENVLSFGKHDDQNTQARELFDRLRQFDDMNVEKIYSRLPSEYGVGLAVYNRLIRAAGFEIINVN